MRHDSGENGDILVNRRVRLVNLLLDPRVSEDRNILLNLYSTCAQ